MRSHHRGCQEGHANQWPESQQQRALTLPNTRQTGENMILGLGLITQQHENAQNLLKQVHAVGVILSEVQVRACSLPVEPRVSYATFRSRSCNTTKRPATQQAKCEARIRYPPYHGQDAASCQHETTAIGSIHRSTSIRSTNDPTALSIATSVTYAENTSVDAQ